MMLDLQRQILDLDRRLERLEKPDTGGVIATFTPTYEGSSTAGTTTYTTQVGRYIRIGNLVVVTLHMVWTNATGTGNVRIGGLPYAASATSNLFYSFQPQTNNLTFANGSIEGLLQSNATQAQLSSPASNAALTELSVEAAGTIRATIIYFTD